MLEYLLDIEEDSYARLYPLNKSDAPFPNTVVESGYYRGRSGYFTKRDGLDQLLLLYTSDGEGTITWKGKTYTLFPGMIVLIDAKIYQEYGTGSTGKWHLRWIGFQGNGVDGFASTLMNALTPVMLTDPEKVEALYNRIESVDLARGIVGYAEMSQCVSEIMMEMLRSLYEDQHVRSYGRREIEKLVEYIRLHHREQLTMEDFMQVTHLSRYHLIRIFRNQMGVPPYHYLQQCRIMRAQELLNSTNMSVSEVGTRVGFPDAVNFIRVFRNLTGKTPAAYRKENVQYLTVES